MSVSSLIIRVLMEPTDRSQARAGGARARIHRVWRARASSLLVGAAGLGVSSATVRNILARLEDEGFVQQPHTSAGRIPTDRGYRFYVDLLLESKRSAADGERGRGAAAARQRRERSSIPSCRRPRTSCPRRRATSVSRCGRRTRRRCSIASSSSR